MNSILKSKLLIYDLILIRSLLFSMISYEREFEDEKIKIFSLFEKVTGDNLKPQIYKHEYDLVKSWSENQLFQCIKSSSSKLSLEEKEEIVRANGYLIICDYGIHNHENQYFLHLAESLGLVGSKVGEILAEIKQNNSK